MSGTITLDRVVVKTYAGATAFSWAGSGFTLVYSQATSAGSHKISGDFTWPGKTTDNNGHVKKTVECPAPPSTIGITVHKVAVEATPVAGTATGSASIPLTQPATTPAGTTPPGTTPTPAGGILPETIRSGRAQLRSPSGCVKAFRARVTGRSIASVAFYVDGKLVKRISDRRRTYTVKIKPQRYGFGRHRVAARVRFVAASGTAPRTLRLTFGRCAQDAVAPRFTG